MRVLGETSRNNTPTSGTSLSGKGTSPTILATKSGTSRAVRSDTAPAGKWRILKFTHKQAPGLIQQGGSQLSVDGASKDCVDWFLQTVYQPHFEHYGAEFGKTIRGFFYDEPETPGDWGTELNRVLAEWNVDWKKAYVAYKFELAGEEHLLECVPFRPELVGQKPVQVVLGKNSGLPTVAHFARKLNVELSEDEQNWLVSKIKERALATKRLLSMAEFEKLLAQVQTARGTTVKATPEKAMV